MVHFFCLFLFFPVLFVSALSSMASENENHFSFEEIMVDGQYHFSNEAVVTVEDDKVLDGLLGVPENFRERVNESLSQK